MSQNVLEFRFKPVRMSIWILGFALMTLGFAWMAYASLDPDMYNAFESRRYAWVSDMFESMPIWARVAIWAALALLCGWAGFSFVRRWMSGMPVLQASAQGLTGYSSGMGLRRVTMAWNDIETVQVANSNVIFRAKSNAAAGARKHKPPVIVANLSMIGERYEQLMQKLSGVQSGG
jgi:hypothetical protein